MTGTERAITVRKMHGAENAFVVLDERPPHFAHYDELARTLCAAGGAAGGADGLLVIREPAGDAGAAAEMRVYNADGSEAEMCGNGVRCVARYLHERGAGAAFGIATLAGLIGVEILASEPFAARVDIGTVRFPRDAEEEAFEALGATWNFRAVSLGNPHAVVLVEDVDAIDLAALGAAAQKLQRFPAGTNLHVAQIEDANTIRVRHFERGVGLTRACGTGAVACAAVAIETRAALSPVAVLVPGGTLGVVWRRGETARLSGGAETLFERTLRL